MNINSEQNITNDSKIGEKLTSELLITELLKSIENGEISIKEVAKFFDSSDRTIQKKISNLGYKWDAKAMKYNYDATKNESEYGQDELPKIKVIQVFEKRVNKKPIQKKNIITTGNNNIKDNKENNITNNKNDNNNTSKIASEVDISGDRILEILSGKKPEKKYIGFYADKDVSDMLDSIEGRVKSELINECIRIVLKSKGLM